MGEGGEGGDMGEDLKEGGGRKGGRGAAPGVFPFKALFATRECVALIKTPLAHLFSIG